MLLHNGMQMAETADGRWVTLNVGVPVYRDDRLIGFNTYILAQDQHTAVRVFQPVKQNKESVT